MQLLPKQNEFVMDMQSKIVAFVGGFGSGKTTAACVKALFLAGYNVGCAGMLVSPTYGMLRDTTRRTFLQILNDYEIAYTFRVNENRIILRGLNSEIWFRSADDPNKLKGSTLAWVGLDEPGLMVKEAYTYSLARARDKRARVRQLFMTGTPEGLNWLYEELIEKKNNKMRVIKSKTTDNYYLPTDSVDALKNSYDDKMIKQYLDGEFINVYEGRAYYNFDRELHVRDVRDDKITPIILCVDFNVNPLIWVICQINNNIVNVIDEICLRDSNTKMASEEFKRRYPNRKVYVYGDYSGIGRSTNSPTTDYAIIKEIINPQEIRIKQNPRVIDRINAVNAKLRNSWGAIGLFVNPNCKELILDLERVIVNNFRELDKTDKARTHASDGLGYFIEYEYGLRGKPIISYSRY